MAKLWMKFKCENCLKERWLHEDINILKQERAIVYCSNCGCVKGLPDKLERADEHSYKLICIPFTCRERKMTRGPVGPDVVMTAETCWGTADGTGPEQGLSRAAYMVEYGEDPWTSWCRRFPDKIICQDDGFGKSYRDRCKLDERPKEDGGPVGGP